MCGATGVSLQLHQILPLPRKKTSICITNEMSFTMRRATRVSPQLHQILRLPRNLTGQDCSGKPFKPLLVSAKRNLISPKIRSSSRSCRFRRPYSSHLGHAFCVEKETFRAPAISENFTKCRACHEKSQSTSCTPPSANTAPATKKKNAWLIGITYETSFTMSRATRVTL